MNQEYGELAHWGLVEDDPAPITKPMAMKVGALVHLTEDALENIESEMETVRDDGSITRKRWAEVSDAIELHVEKNIPFEITNVSEDGVEIKAGDVRIEYLVPFSELEEV
jgi:hypothetical protein